MIEWDKEVEWILGRPNFWCAAIANRLRDFGQEIPKHAEEEQAATIYWLLTMYEKYKDHPDGWRAMADIELSQDNNSLKTEAKKAGSA